MVYTPLIGRAILAATVVMLAGPSPAQSLGGRARATIVIRASVMPRFKVVAVPGAPAQILTSSAPALRVRLVAGPVRRSADGTAAAQLLLIVPD